MDASAPTQAASPLPIPDYPGHWLTGVLEERRRDPIGFFTRVAELGDVSRFRVVNTHVYGMNHPDAVKHVLVDNAQNYWKGSFAQFLKPLLGQGLLLADGEFWKRNRRIVQPAFHREALGRMVEGMAEPVTRMVSRWSGSAEMKSAPFDLAPELMALTMSIVARALFTSDVTDRADGVREALNRALSELNVRIVSSNPLRPLFPTRQQRAFREAVKALDEVVFRIIAARRAEGSPDGRHDLLAMLMQTEDADTGEKMTDAQLRDEVMTLFLAGHETTAGALTFLFFVFSQHPGVEASVRTELAGALQGRDLKISDLAKLPYTQRVIDETLRLYPPVWLFTRQAYREDVVLGHRLPPKAIITVCPYSLHRDSRFWSEPERFDPDRFLPENVQKRPRLAYVPFGGGQRLCIGNQFALLEMVLVLSRVLAKFHLKVEPGQTLELQPMITIRAKHGLRVRLEPRSD